MRVTVLILFYLISSCSRSDIIQPEKKNIVETVYASGKVISANEYYIHAIAGGKVIKKLVKEGDTVAKGQVLYELKNEASAARLEAAYSSYNNAKANLSSTAGILNELKLNMYSAGARFNNDSLHYARLSNLFRSNIGTRSYVDAAYTQFVISRNQLKSAEERYYATVNELKVAMHNAESQLVAAQTDLDNYFIKSESAGMVFQTYKEVGETARPNDVMAMLGATSERIIKLAVDQQDVDKIRTGQAVLLKTDITGNSIYHGSITRIYPVMNETDQTFRVDAVFVNASQQPFIHSSVEANIIIKESGNALVIPRNAILTNDSVRVIRDGKERTVAIQTGIHTIDYIEVVNGLDESSKVVIPIKK